MILISKDDTQLLRIDLLPIEVEPERHRDWLTYRLEFGLIGGVRSVLQDQTELYLNGTDLAEVPTLVAGLTGVASGMSSFRFTPADEKEFALTASRKEGALWLEMEIRDRFEVAGAHHASFEVDELELRRFAEGLMLELEQLGFLP